MAPDSLELHLASALQRFNTLQRRADTARDTGSLLARSLAELGRALEDVRIAQEQLIESRTRVNALQEELRQQATKYWQLFDEIPQPCMLTKVDSTILEVNKAAAELLNVSQRFLVGKTLSLFVCEDRGSLLQTCTRVGDEGSRTEMSLKIRPRERAPLDVTARLVGGNGQLRWLLSVPFRATPPE